MKVKSGQTKATLMQWRATPLSERELFRVLRLYYEPTPHRPREVLQKLRSMLAYRDWSERRLRRLLERVFKDPRTDSLLSITIIPPTNEQLAKQLCQAIPELQEAIVIPSLKAIDPNAINTYLGIAAAQVFAPRFQSGQGIGFSGGQSIRAMTQALLLPHSLRLLRLYALTRCPPTVFGFTAEGIVSEIIAKNLWRTENWETLPKRFLEGYLNPKRIQPELLDWVFMEVGALEAGELVVDFADELNFDVAAAKQGGVVAELLGYLFCADGLPPIKPIRPLNLETVPLSLLRTMVRNGKFVVALAGGPQKAVALLALHRAQRAGGALFNVLVTDEDCARQLLSLCDRPIAETDAIWEQKRKRFWAAHLRFAASERCRTYRALAQKMHLSERNAARLLDEALHGINKQTPPLVFVRLKAPKPEPIPLLELESALMERLGLMEVRVVRPVRDEWPYPALGIAAAQWLKEHWQSTPELSVGLGGGRAVRALLEALNLPFCLRYFPKLQRLNLFALQARPRERVIWGEGITTFLATVVMRCFGTAEGQKVVCHSFCGDEVADLLDVVFASIGAFEVDDQEVLKASGIALEEVKGAAGTLLGQPFDSTGQTLGYNLGKRLQVLSLQRLKKLVRDGVPVFVFVSGLQRAKAAVAAWRGGLFNCMIVDKTGAEAMLSEI